VAFAVTAAAGPSPGFSSRGTKNQKEGPKTGRGGHIFKIQCWDVCSNRWVKREMEGHRFKMGGPGTTDPPCDGPVQQS